MGSMTTMINKNAESKPPLLLAHFQRMAIALLMLMALQGCASFASSGEGVNSANTSNQSGADSRSSSAGLDEVEDLSDADQNLILSEGYSQLYEAAKGFKFLDEALLLKFETDEFQAFVEQTSAYFADLETTLEQLNENYPSISLDNTGLPLLEKRTRSAVQKARLASLAPLTGASGIEFERTLLLTLSGAFNQLQFLVREMQDVEKSDERITLLMDMQENFDRLYAADLELLDRKYFIQ